MAFLIVTHSDAAASWAGWVSCVTFLPRQLRHRLRPPLDEFEIMLCRLQVVLQLSELFRCSFEPVEPFPLLFDRLLNVLQLLLSVRQLPYAFGDEVFKLLREGVSDLPVDQLGQLVAEPDTADVVLRCHSNSSLTAARCTGLPSAPVLSWRSGA